MYRSLILFSQVLEPVLLPSYLVAAGQVAWTSSVCMFTVWCNYKPALEVPGSARHKQSSWGMGGSSDLTVKLETLRPRKQPDCSWAGVPVLRPQCSAGARIKVPSTQRKPFD